MNCVLNEESPRTRVRASERVAMDLLEDRDFHSDGEDRVTYQNYDREVSFKRKAAFWEDDDQSWAVSSTRQKRDGASIKRTAISSNEVIAQRFSLEESREDFAVVKAHQQGLKKAHVTDIFGSDTVSQGEKKHNVTTLSSSRSVSVRNRIVDDIDRPTSWGKPSTNSSKGKLPPKAQRTTSSISATKQSTLKLPQYVTAPLPLSATSQPRLGGPQWLRKATAATNAQASSSASYKSVPVPQQFAALENEDIVDTSFEHVHQGDDTLCHPQEKFPSPPGNYASTFRAPTDQSPNHPAHIYQSAQQHDLSFMKTPSPAALLSSPAKGGKARSSTIKVGSLRWKLQKVMRDVDNLESWISTPSLVSIPGGGGLHDPRNRCNWRCKANVTQIVATLHPFLLAKIFIPIDNEDRMFLDISNVNLTNKASFFAVVLLRTTGTLGKSLNDSSALILYDPCELPIEVLNQSYPLLANAVSKGKDHMTEVEKVYVCFSWEHSI